MNRFEKLIEEYCPEGVEFKKLKDICKNITSGGTPLSTMAKYYNGNIPWLRTQEVNWKDIYETEIKITEEGLKNSSAKWIPKNCVIVAMYGATTARVGINKIPLTTNQACCNLQVDELKANYKYVFYWLSKEYENLKGLGEGSQANINSKKVKEYLIPIPSLPVQQEIVKILDKFTQLEAELEAELEARRKQYEYYRTKLLTFTPPLQINNCESTRYSTWVKVKDVFRMKNGFTPSKSKSEYWEGGKLPWFRVEDIRQNGRILSDSIQHITPAALKGKKLFPANSIIVSTSATIGEHALITVESLSNQRFTYLTKNKMYDKKLNMQFFNYYMYIISEWCKNNTNTASFHSVDMNKFRNHLIPIPSLSEQERIVSILDRFDALVNDTTIGLQAEIVARRKQYEYYRNKLLTFAEYE